MSEIECKALRVVVNELMKNKVSFVLIHESALMAWGLDDNVFLNTVDVLLYTDASFGLLDLVCPQELGGFIECEFAGVKTRLWSRQSLGIKGKIEVTLAGHYGCESLAPEAVLTKLPYSPDARLLIQQRAKLAAVINAEQLTDEELTLLAKLTYGI